MTELNDLTDCISDDTTYVFLGTGSGAAITTGGGPGVNNTAGGINALNVMTSGNGNTAFGYEALGSVTSGSYNAAFGDRALALNTGDRNTGVGEQAAASITTGSQNVGVGYTALNTNASGSNNTALGYGADVDSSAPTNRTAIGAHAVCTADNSVQIGDSSVTAVNFGAAGTTLGTSLALAGNPTTTTQSSSDNSTKIATTAFVQSAISAISSPFTSEFISSTQTLPGLNTKVSVAHGFGGKPKLVRVTLICTTADQGFSVGDEIEMMGPAAAGIYAANLGAVISVDATNVNISTLNAGTSPFLSVPKGGGTSAQYYTSANWGMKVYAWK